MSLANCVHTRTKITSFEQFCDAISEYIDVPGQTLNNALFTDEEFEAVAQLNDAFAWPEESNWINWREGLRQIFFYAQLSDQQLSVLENNNLSWLQGSPFFLHISNDDPTQVAYLPERDDLRVGDRMQRGRLGRFFTNHLDMTNENLVREIIGTFQADQHKWLLSDRLQDIVRVYQHGPNSCMSGVRNEGFAGVDPNDPKTHPAAAYASGDFAILASYSADGDLDDPNLRFSGRCLISLPYLQFIRIYGNTDSMCQMLNALHLNPAFHSFCPSNSFWNENELIFSNCNYDRLIHRKLNRLYPWPYVDAPNSVAVYDFDNTTRYPKTYRLLDRESERNVRGVKHLLLRSTAGRTSPPRSRTGVDPHYSSLYVDQRQAHDAQLETNRSLLFERFTELTQPLNPEERVFRPVAWNARPVVETYECGFCNETHTINPDGSNVVNYWGGKRMHADHTSNCAVIHQHQVVNLNHNPMHPRVSWDACDDVYLKLEDLSTMRGLLRVDHHFEIYESPSEELDDWVHYNIPTVNSILAQIHNMARALQRRNPDGNISKRHWLTEAWETLSYRFVMALSEDDFHDPTDICFTPIHPDYDEHTCTTRNQHIDAQFFHYFVVPFIKDIETEEARLEEAA
ncbi:MAG: hypothetical protein VW443_02330 [Pseudomonadales bacterium]